MTALLSRPRVLLILPLLLVLLPPVVNGATLIQLTSQPGIDRHPSWTPDGQSIIYESASVGGNLNIWRIPATGGVPVQLSALPADERMPEVSPDGTKIAFTYGSGSQASIYSMPIGGGGPFTQISFPNVSGDLDWHSSWTPDGSTIYFSRRLGNDSPNWDIYKVPSTGGPRTLVYGAPGIQNRPQVSSSGLQLTFENDFNSGALNVVKANVATPASQTQLTFFSQNTADNDWSPNDAKILYSTRQNLGQFELWELDLTTLVHTRLTFDVGVEPFDPNNTEAVYSPDGSRIAFTSRRLTGNDNIWILDRNAPVAVVLSRFEAVESDAGVRLEWNAVEDADHLLFNLFRAVDEHGPWTPVNDTPIRGSGSYAFVDVNAAPGSRTQYELEAVDRLGARQIVGRLAVDYQIIARRLQLAGYPNPTRLGSNIRVHVPDATSLQLDIFDASGRRVRVLEAGSVLDAGWHEYQWDGRSDTGLPVASGIYHVRAQTPTGLEQLRLVRTN